jgi:hypothetical protein
VYCGCCECGWITLNQRPEDTTREQGMADIAEYTEWVTPRLVQCALEAVASLEAAELYHGLGSCDIAVNRRNNVESEVSAMAAAGQLEKSSLAGPFDHSVEVLIAKKAGVSAGPALAVAFGYACHATVMGASSMHGDWPGCAMANLEGSGACSIAMHINGCSGDQNPLPRRKIELMEKYGQQMADTVSEVVAHCDESMDPCRHPTSSSAILRPPTPIQGDNIMLRCVAVALSLRYHELPSEADLIRTRDSTGELRVHDG